MKSIKTQKVERKVLSSNKGSIVKRAFALLSALFLFQLTFAQDVAADIEQLMEQQIMPIVNVIVAAALIFSAVYAGILFFQGKKEGLKIVGYIIAGALVIKFMAEIAGSIIGTN